MPPLVADLTSDVCPERGASDAREARYLDTRKLAKSLRNRVALLRKGESPAKLALGEDCVQPSCEELLVYLYRQWCQPKLARASERRAADRSAEACSELPGIHYYISGRVFSRPLRRPSSRRSRRRKLPPSGASARVRRTTTATPRGSSSRSWAIEDESAQGMRMVRRSEEAGKRMAHGQLIGVRPADGKHFMLAQVRWLMGADNGDIHAGVKLLPGLPRPLAVRPTGLNVQADSWVPAIALSAVPALESPPSLVLPSGWYKPKRVIELHDHSRRRRC